MIKILYICLGNICRSPMAEYITKDLLNKAQLSSSFEVASAATSSWEIGNPVYPPAREKLKEHGIDCTGKKARQLTIDDYDYYNYLVVMDESNLKDVIRLTNNDPQDKVSLLLSHIGQNRAVKDPWYTGDFEATWNDILMGCEALIDELKAKHHINEA